MAGVAPPGAHSARPGQPGVGSVRSLVTAPSQQPGQSVLPGSAGLSLQDGPGPGVGRDSAPSLLPWGTPPRPAAWE